MPSSRRLLALLATGLLPVGPLSAQDDGDWPSWWAREKGPLLDLRASLFPAPPASADLPAGYVSLPSSERRARVLPALLEALKDRVPSVRRAAAVALGKSQEAEALAPLLQVAKSDPDREARHGALLGLGLLASPGALSLLKETVENPKELSGARLYGAAALGFCGGGTASLRSVLSDGAGRAATQEVRITAAYAIGTSGDRSAAPFLVGALSGREEKDALVRAAMLVALGRLGEASALPIVEAMLDAEDPSVRAAACGAFASLRRAGDPSAAARLSKIAEGDSQPFVRARALLALGALGGEEARASLRRALGGSSALGTKHLVPYTALALALAGTEADEAALLAAWRREHGMHVRGAIALALGLLGATSAAPALVAEVEGVGNPTTFKYVAVALGLLRTSAAAAPLEAILDRERDPLVVRAAALGRGLLGDAGVLASIEDRLRKESSAAMVGALAAALGDLGDARSVDALLKTCRQPGLADAAHVEVIFALGKLADRSPHPSMSRFSRGTLPWVSSPTLDWLIYGIE